jgi:hypothetical protein
LPDGDDGLEGGAEEVPSFFIDDTGFVEFKSDENMMVAF